MTTTPAADARPREPLTARQAEVLHYIRHHIRTHRIPPTLREIGAAVGISSPNGVAGHVILLRRKGYLIESDGTARSLVPADDGPDPLTLLTALVRAVRGDSSDRGQLMNAMLDGQPEWRRAVELTGEG